MKTKSKTYRVKDGKAEVLCGGYVSWDGRKLAGETYPERSSKEIRVWMPAGCDYADCGYNTNALAAALSAIVVAKGKKNVETQECWQY